MTLFTNSNFIDHIARSLEGGSTIKEEYNSMFQTLIELQTRNVLQTAIKFMRRDRRDKLTLQDIELALKELKHSEIKLNILGNEIEMIKMVEKQEQETIPLEFILERQMSLIKGLRVEKPRLQGKWIFVNGKIPKTNDNKDLKCLSEVLAEGQRQKQERNKIMNVIRDEPFALLTKQQSDYCFKMISIVEKDKNQNGFVIQGNVNSVFPFILKYLSSTPLNETGIILLINFLENKYIWRAVEFYLMKILNILLTYQGLKAFEVGLKLAQLVHRFDDKYPILRDIFEDYNDQGYSTILKKVAFELQVGIPIKLNELWLENCNEEANSGNHLAIKCRDLLLTFASKLKYMKQYLANKNNTFIYWHPCAFLKNDPYLQMF